MLGGHAIVMGEKKIELVIQLFIVLYAAVNKETLGTEPSEHATQTLRY